MAHEVDKRCIGCIFAKFVKQENINDCGYTCNVDSEFPVFMPMNGRCSERQKFKNEQYPQKASN